MTIEFTQEQVHALQGPLKAPAHVINPNTQKKFVLVPLADYERLMGDEEFDDGPVTDEERDLIRWEACEMLDSFGKQP